VRRAIRARSRRLRTRCPAQLQETLTATEDKIEFARRYYNTSARDYNIALQTFPRNLIAGPFHFTAVAFFAADEEDRAVPQVSFAGTDAAAAGPPSASAAAGPPSAAAAEPEGPPPAVAAESPPPTS
jgi:hypothetical protein